MAALRSRWRSLLLRLPIRNTRPTTNLTGARPKSLRFSTVTLTKEEIMQHGKYLKDAEGSKVSPALGNITRRAFPILQQEFGDFRMIYMDNAATSQKPLSVLHVLNDYNKSFNSTVHSGIHSLSAEAIDLYELTRAKVAAFINAMESREIVLTRNATEAINLVAYSWGLSILRSGDEILLTIAEHHSAIVPWQLVAQKTGATLTYVGLTKEEVPDMEQLKGLLSSKTKLVVTHHVSHTLGYVMPINEIVIWAHDVGAKVLVDACQSVAHMAVDVQKLDIDFLVASSHKMCGPTGIGFLYGKSKLLSEMVPFLGGSKMISDVSQDYSTFAQHPSRFEAGTPAIAEAAGLAAAIDYLSSVGMQEIHDYEKELANFLYHCLLSVKHVRVYGPAPSDEGNRAPLCLFNVENIHPMDIASCLYEQHGVAICSGHHCAQPLHRSLGINASVRASCRFYNTKDEINYLCYSLEHTISYIQSYRNRTFMRCSFTCEADDCGCTGLT